MEVKILLDQRKGAKMLNVGEEQIKPQVSLEDKKTKQQQKTKRAFTLMSLATVELINVRLM